MKEDLRILQRIDIKEEDLNPNQLKIAREINYYIDQIEELLKSIINSNNHFAIADDLSKIAGYYGRVGGYIADLDYEYNKILDIGELLVNQSWQMLNEDGHSAAVCNKLSELVLDESWRKKRRVAKWLLERAKYQYASIEKVLNSCNRKHDDLRDEYAKTKLQP